MVQTVSHSAMGRLERINDSPSIQELEIKDILATNEIWKKIFRQVKELGRSISREKHLLFKHEGLS